jgi:hypothetical protein
MYLFMIIYDDIHLFIVSCDQKLCVLMIVKRLRLNQTAEDKQFLDLGVAPKSIIANDLKEEDLAEEAFVGLSGYKRIFFSLLLLCIFSIGVIGASLPK